MRKSGLTSAVVVFSAAGSVTAAVKAVKDGAYDFLEKPVGIDAIGASIARAVEKARLQRHAKYRQWRSGSGGWPWPDSSDQAVPDMTEASLRMQDTLNNAVMSARPVVASRELIKHPDNDKRQKAVDALHDTQFFVEQDGEGVIEQATESFCNDPAVTFFVPWVKENRELTEVRSFDPIPGKLLPSIHFAELLKQNFAEHERLWDRMPEALDRLPRVKALLVETAADAWLRRRT